MFFSSAAKHLFLIVATSSCFRTPFLVESVPCGRWYSSACLGEKDKRYDDSYTNNIREQDPLWADQEGFWMATSKSYDSNDQPNQPMMFDPTNLASGFGLPYTRDSSIAYVNITLSGSRYYEHRYQAVSAAPQAFCDLPVIPPKLNVLDNGKCGVNGYASWTEEYATSSYEKDGTLVPIGGGLSFSLDKSFNRASGFKTVIGDDVIFGSSAGTNQGGAATNAKVWTFTNKAKTKADAQLTIYNTIGDESYLIGYTKYKYSKISEEEFTSGIEDLWTEKNVQEDNRGALPMGECLGVGGCPTEEDWCVTDPNCSKSKYQEPDGVTRAEVIAGFTISGAVIIIAILYMLHLKKIKTMKANIRKTLIKGLSNGGDAGLTMDQLVEEFKKIDESGDGFVQKSELEKFAKSGKIGELSDKQFEQMFAAIDTDKSGEIDFIEFVNFVGLTPTNASQKFVDNA